MTSLIPELKTLANKHCVQKPKPIDHTVLTDILRETLNHWILLRKPVTIAAVVDPNGEPGSEQIEPEQTLPVGEPMAIERTFHFENYFGAVAFVNALANMIHREDHHPEIQLNLNRCRVKWDTHSVDGVSMNDLICAAKCDVIRG